VDGGAIVDAAAASDSLIGRTLSGRYLVRQRIGQGGMGVVYEADHVALDKRVALKFLLDKYTEDREVLARFHQEARTASRIGHENIIDIIDIGESEDGRSYIVMEFLEGADLAQILRDSGAMHPTRAVGIIKQVLRGLAAAHAKGIIHRDMKPENVFVTSRGDNPDFIKIMDFGISKIIDAHDSKVRLTETGAVVGTPIYMAPEQARAEQTVDQRVDVYAAGVMFYEMLCGRPPFMAANYLELVTQHLFDPPPPMRVFRPGLPEVLEAVTMRALAKEPAARWANATELSKAIPDAISFAGGSWDALSTISGTAPDIALPRAAAYAAPTTTPDKPVKRRSLAPYVVIGAAVLAAGAMVAITMMMDRRADTALRTVTDTSQPTAAPAPSPSVEPIESILEIDSRPQGATVYVDGVSQGVTPVTVRNVARGVRTIRLEKEGFQTLEVGKPVREGYTEPFFGALAETGSTQPSVSARPTREPTKHARPGPRPRPRPPTATRPPPTATRPPPAETKPPPAETKPPPAETRPPPAETKPNPYLDNKPSPYN
jgi:serine/threonine-protein kinase